MAAGNELLLPLLLPLLLLLASALALVLVLVLELTMVLVLAMVLVLLLPLLSSSPLVLLPPLSDSPSIARWRMSGRSNDMGLTELALEGSPADTPMRLLEAPFGDELANMPDTFASQYKD